MYHMYFFAYFVMGYNCESATHSVNLKKKKRKKYYYNVAEIVCHITEHTFTELLYALWSLNLSHWRYNTLMCLDDKNWIHIYRIEYKLSTLAIILHWASSPGEMGGGGGVMDAGWAQVKWRKKQEKNSQNSCLFSSGSETLPFQNMPHVKIQPPGFWEHVIKGSKSLQIYTWNHSHIFF